MINNMFEGWYEGMDLLHYFGVFLANLMPLFQK